MQYQPKLSTLCVSMLTAATLFASGSSFAAHHYKGDYKNEVIPAAPCVQPLMLKDGFYIGAQGGYDSYRARETISTSVGGTALTGTGTGSIVGWEGGLYAGYGMYFNGWTMPFYLGAEIFGNGSNASQSQSAAFGTGSVYTNVNVRGDWGVSALPGLKVNDSSLVYVRLGWDQARFNTQETFALGATSINASQNTWRSGFNYGVGLETAVYQNVSIRGEYTHTNFGSSTSSLGTSYSLSNNRFMAGLTYHFS